MNLAIRDIRHNAGRFALTTVGIGLLLMIVMGMAASIAALFRACPNFAGLIIEH
jgi:hypothetical protein